MSKSKHNSDVATLECFITDANSFANGALVGEWVEFPTTPEKLQDVYDSLGVESSEQVIVTDFESRIPNLHKGLGEHENIDKLNFLAKRIQEVEERGQIDTFKRYLELDTFDLEQLIEIADQEFIDNVFCVPNIEDTQQLGIYLVEELDYFNFNSLPQSKYFTLGQTVKIKII